MTVNQIWIRIIDSILSGAAFSIFACILMFARYRKQNSKGVLFAIAFCIITAGNAFCVAYDLYNNSHVLMTIIGPLASVTKILFALYCWHNFSAIAIVVRKHIQDYFLQNNPEAHIDRQQRRINLGYLSEMTRARATAVLSWTMMRSTANDNPDSGVGINPR